MIKITSFYPFNSFLRITQEFYEDKFIAKTKSLTFENEVEYPYSKVTEISDSHSSSGSQMFFGWVLIGLAAIGFSILYNVVCGVPVLIRIIQILFIFGVLLLGTGLIKSRYIFFSDKDNNVITYIKQTRRNREKNLQVIEMIKARTVTIQEIKTADPFPKSDPVFEHIYYDYSKPEKTIDRFYDKGIVGLQKSLLNEGAYSIQYSEFNGKLFRGKTGNKLLERVFSTMVFVLSIMVVLNRGFNILAREFLLYTIYFFAIMLFLSFILIFFKRETIGFYGNEGRLRYWSFVNRKNKEKIEKIVEFVISRIPDANKEMHPKEQA